MSLKWQCIVVDCIDPGPLARWWADLLGWRITFEEPDEVVLEPPEGSPEDGVSPDILFGRVPETKQIKNRIHFDLRPDDQALEVARAEALGARRVDVGQDETVTWVVLADPGGNEYCILRALTPDDTPSADAPRDNRRPPGSSRAGAESHPRCRFRNMPIVRITVTAVSDEGDNVVVWGRAEHAPAEGEPIGFVFQTKGEQADITLAERASRLVGGTEAAIDYIPVAGGWNLGRGLSAFE